MADKHIERLLSKIKGYRPRIIEPQIEELLSVFGAIELKGPKWCGKTTTAARFSNSALLLADPSNGFAQRRRAQLQPIEALEGEEPRLLDEWQEAPGLWDAVRFECDVRPGAGHFILTGSATPNFKPGEKPVHSGAGRIGSLSMDTMTLFETGESTGEASLGAILEGEEPRGAGSLGLEDVTRIIMRGGWPSAIDSPQARPQILPRQDLMAVAEADATQIDGVRRSPERVMRVLRSLARNESTIASCETIIADAKDISKETVKDYLRILRQLHVIDDIMPWGLTLRSRDRVRKAKKHHFCDVSLAAAALHATEAKLMKDHETLGLLFESLAIHDMRVYAQSNDAELYHYHDYNDLEVDIVIETWDGRWAAFEVKLAMNQLEKASANLMRMRRRMAKVGAPEPACLGVIVGIGGVATKTEEGICVLPIDCLGP